MYAFTHAIRFGIYNRVVVALFVNIVPFWAYIRGFPFVTSVFCIPATLLCRRPHYTVSSSFLCSFLSPFASPCGAPFLFRILLKNLILFFQQNQQRTHCHFLYIFAFLKFTFFYWLLLFDKIIISINRNP